METATKENPKVLFIGEERICQQVAYVLTIENYEIKNFDFLKNLTEANDEKYCDYQIYVCEFKRKSKKLIDKKVLFNQIKLFYLDDICKNIDKEVFLNKRNNRKLLKNELNKKAFRTRVKLIFNKLLRLVYYRFKGFQVLQAAKHRKYEKIKYQHRKYLRCLKPSVLFLYVIYAPINPHINCSSIETHMQIISDLVYGCCSMSVPFGSVIYDGEIEDLYRGIYARIVKLSSLNGSYCLCDLSRWCPCYCKENSGYKEKEYVTQDMPNTVTVAFDYTCNLCCKSCRSKPLYRMDIADEEKVLLIEEKLLNSKFLDQIQMLTVAGVGEVFYSPYYRRLLETDLKRKNIYLLTNGTLFNEENWNLIKDKYETIDLIISIDAATKETYKKLRSGNFDVLLSNLRMISDLHRQRKIRNWSLNFVVQHDNYLEMIAFVKLGRSLGVDRVSFLKMDNWGHLTHKEYLQKCMVIDESYLDYDLWKVLQDPVFQDPIVDLNGFTRYIEESKSRYADK